MKLGVNSGERDRDGIRTQGREREFNHNTFTHVWNFKRGKKSKNLFYLGFWHILL